MCLVLFFYLFDLSDSSKVACVITRSGLQSVHTQKSHKGHNIASCEQWAASKQCTCLAVVPLLCEQPEPRRSGGNHSRDHADPPLVLSWAELRSTLAVTVTGTAEYGQDTHSQDTSVQVWTPSKRPLKWQDTRQLLSQVTQSTTLARQYVQANVLTLWTNRIFKQLCLISKYL